MLRRINGIVLSAFLLTASCRLSTNTPDTNIMHFADLECRAIRLREQRFALANRIRFAQDTLLHFSSVRDTVALADSLRFYLREKESLLQASLMLADTIHRQLDSLRKFSFKSAEDKHLFDKKLNDELKKRGYENR